MLKLELRSLLRIDHLRGSASRSPIADSTRPLTLVHLGICDNEVAGLLACRPHVTDYVVQAVNLVTSLQALCVIYRPKSRLINHRGLPTSLSRLFLITPFGISRSSLVLSVSMRRGKRVSRMTVRFSRE